MEDGTDNADDERPRLMSEAAATAAIGAELLRKYESGKSVTRKFCSSSSNGSCANKHKIANQNKMSEYTKPAECKTEHETRIPVQSHMQDTTISCRALAPKVDSTAQS